MLNVIFIPLMKTTIPRYELAVNSIKLAQTIPDTVKRNTCIAAAFAFACKYIKNERIKDLLEVMKMNELMTMLVEDAVIDAENK